MYYLPDAMDLLRETLKSHYSLLNTIIHDDKKKIIENINLHKQDIKHDTYVEIERLLKGYLDVANSIDEPNKGIVTSIKGHYGFISNKLYQKKKAIHFLVSNANENIQIGDCVIFELSINQNGFSARNVKTVLFDSED